MCIRDSGGDEGTGLMAGAEVLTGGAATKGKARVNLGDTMRVRIGVADLGGRILKWPKTDEKL